VKGKESWARKVERGAEDEKDKGKGTQQRTKHNTAQQIFAHPSKCPFLTDVILLCFFFPQLAFNLSPSRPVFAYLVALLSKSCLLLICQAILRRRRCVCVSLAIYLIFYLILTGASIIFSSISSNTPSNPTLFLAPLILYDPQPLPLSLVTSPAGQYSDRLLLTLANNHNNRPSLPCTDYTRMVSYPPICTLSATHEPRWTKKNSTSAKRVI
jgi:hypothetical protein